MTIELKRELVFLKLPRHCLLHMWIRFRSNLPQAPSILVASHTETEVGSSLVYLLDGKSSAGVKQKGVD